MFRMVRAAYLAAAMVVGSGIAHAADLWITPTQDELKMTSFPQAPGASAVILNYDELTEDGLHMFSAYIRIKILNEEGRKYADYELVQYHGNDGWYWNVDDVQGRTIHPDGTIIPYTGKPYEKVIEKTKENKYTAKVVTLPDVTVGSIIELHYKKRWDDNYYTFPQWDIQENLFKQKAHYVWKPSTKDLHFTDGKDNSRISWTPILPKGTEVKQTQLPAVNGNNGQIIFEVNAKDVPALVEEDYMPPMKSNSYRVMFYYLNYKSADEFWQSEGKKWSKGVDKFSEPSPAVRTFTTETVAGATTQDDKLKKIYAAVMAMDNTDFTRARTASEDKANGLKAVKSADDVLARKRGSSDDLAGLFLAMAKASGMKAYGMAVVRRDDRIFLPGWLSFSQLDDLIAIVVVDGKEQFFDPGMKYVPYGHLDWKHTYAGGIRQTDQGVKVAELPGESYKYSQVQRVADLKLDESGKATGVGVFTFMGAPAVRWRQRATRTDETELNRDLKDAVEAMLPAGMEAEVTKIEQLYDYEKPLKVALKVSGPVGVATSKRMILPGDIYESRAKAAFPHEKRELPVYFNYEVWERDAVRYVLPAGMKVESAPATAQDKILESMLYDISSQQVTNTITVRRNLARNGLIYPVTDYPTIRTFYNKLQAKDQENVVLQPAPAATASAASN